MRRMTRSDRENAHAVLSNYNLYANDDIPTAGLPTESMF